MKRKIPVFKVVASEGESYDKMLEVPEIRDIVLEETLFAIKEGINKKKKSISLFEVADSNYYIELEKDKWKSSLETVLNYYAEREEYDMCIECRDLMNKL